MLHRKKKARALALVLIFMAAVTLITTSTVVIVSRYNHNLRRHVEELRETVYDGVEEPGA